MNLRDAKNAVGAFHQPRGVLVDVAFVETLERRECVAGLVEALKIGVVRDASLVDRVGALAGALDDRNTLTSIVHRAVELKAEIVSADEREAGTRALLNFGHTIGHALESATAYRRWLHGEAVAIGIVAALRLSVRTSGLDAAGAGRVIGVLEALGAPTRDPETRWPEVEANLARDKKTVGGRPAFVLTPRIGSGSFGHLIPQDVVREEVASLFGGSGGGAR